MPIEQYILGEN